jgi:hypothetical protein
MESGMRVPDKVAKEVSAGKMQKEVLKLWCLNPLETAVRMNLGVLFEKYLLKYYEDRMNPETFINIPAIEEAKGFEIVGDQEVPEINDLQVDTVDLSGIKAVNVLLSKSFWNVGTLDSMCERIIQYFDSIDSPVVAGSIKYVFRINTHTAEFTFKMNCVRIK